MRIAIDGPAGAGKSTLAKLLAQAINAYSLNTGALYRAVAAAALERSIPLDDDRTLSEVASNLEVERRGSGHDTMLYFSGRAEGEWLRNREVSIASSKISALPGVRAALLGIQRELAAAGDTVVEGRDIGTCVLPDAELKVFVTASAEVRAARRIAQDGLDESEYDSVLRGIRERDERDVRRDIAPLVQAEDAKLLDTSEMSQEESLQLLLGWVHEITQR